ncbi:MAG: S-adenosyl-L-methionine-dependent methyltransferase [Monoraphidium minutum]|nr:MAG: S-adenosyl-L-methionine-dependent methyltransferase [Monoraphidium minutum]
MGKPRNQAAPIGVVDSSSDEGVDVEIRLSGLKPFTALGGLVLYAPSPADAQAEAHSNEEGQVYFGRGGVSLHEGDVVLDLGANVGAFTRMAAPVLGAAGAVYAVEPIQEVAAALRLNARRFQAWADARGLPVARVVPIHAGVGELGGPPKREFTYYPKITAFSSMYRDDEDAAQATLSLVVNRRESFSAIENIGKALARCAPGLYRAIHFAAFIGLLMRPAVAVVCPMTTVSDIIDEHGLREVGLLKANVERAEWDALMGIRKDHWPAIRQVSLQVHDIAGRVSAVEALLRAKGFARVVVYKEPRFRDCNLFMVYGSRAARGAAGGGGAAAAAAPAPARGARRRPAAGA